MTAEEFEDAMSPRTKMVILNSPGNPTGAVYTPRKNCAPSAKSPSARTS